MPGRPNSPLTTLFSLLAVVSGVQADILQFTPDQDATLYEDAEGDIANGAGSYLFMGRTGPDGNSEVRRAVVRFDVSAIPENAVIDNVEVSFDIGQVPFQSATGGTASLHRILSDWETGDSNPPGPEGQGTAAASMDTTWVFTNFNSESWSTFGGDFSLDASSAVGYGTDPETLTFADTEALKRDIRKWIRDPGENFGWILIGNEALDFTARRMDAVDRPGGTPPLLTVEYHVEGPTDNLSLEVLTTVPVRPVVITNAGDGSNRLFIVEPAGVIRIYDLDTDTLLPTPFLDISALVDDSGNEQGLLGLAFHPDFENNRQFYVNYTYDTNPPNGPDRTRIAMYEASVGNPNVADTLEEVILEFQQDFSNHNGGDIHFDPQGYLVIASGDGGSGNDPNNRAQTLTTLLGKLLRIDVDTTRNTEGSTGLCGLVQNYGIPPDNPYVGLDEGCDEILHFGLRNPWRFSFDAATGELFIGDVGQGLWEEISYAPAGATNINYGWKICEGAHVRGSSTTLCEFGELPIIEFSSSGTGNCSVTGGYVYRGGSKILQGRYIYADYCSARVWIATRNGNTWTPEEWFETPSLNSVSTFGQDEQCELYVADFGSIVTNGDEIIYRIVDNEYVDSSGFEALNCR
ncbi:MAG: PQQ-dependent sugar dehydrogenase [Xanthomonadales bacterium]|nr:PQQ-dependent sugar dehydrogenase [Xanthomonadales bacterium]